MPDQPVMSSLLLLRSLTAAVAIATALAAVFAVGAIAYAKAHGINLIDVLTAPIAFVVYAGPPLIALGLASRSRTWTGAAIAAALTALLAVGLVVYHLAPWHFDYWRGNANDVQTQMLVATLFLAWPIALVAAAIWRAVNRETD